MPTHMPALKIAPMASQLLNDKTSNNNNGRKLSFDFCINNSLLCLRFQVFFAFFAVILLLLRFFNFFVFIFGIFEVFLRY